eukprot:scaffold4470_cov255-Prasinococcus_capsulatus_cf.AAC.12
MSCSQGRYEDPDSGTSSFSMLLGRAQHLDHQYTVFGEVVEGLDVLAKLETLETKREGIFVMPKVPDYTTGKARVAEDDHSAGCRNAFRLSPLT